MNYIFCIFAGIVKLNQMSKHTLSQWIVATRPWSFPASATPIIVTLAYLFWKGADINWYFGVWALVNMVLFHVAGNLWSDYRDFVKKVDREPAPGGSSIPAGLFTAEEIKKFAVVVLAVATAGGLGLMAITGLPLLYIGIAGAALTLLYPLLKYNALGDLDILLTFGFLPTVGTSFIVTGAIDWSVCWIAVPVGLITDGILHSNNTRDIISDKSANIKTLAMGIGQKASAAMYAFEVIFPFAWLAICSVTGILPMSTIIVFISLPIALGCAQTMKQSVKGGFNIIKDLDARTANLQMMFSLLLTIAFILSKVF